MIINKLKILQYGKDFRIVDYVKPNTPLAYDTLLLIMETTMVEVHFGQLTVMEFYQLMRTLGMDPTTVKFDKTNIIPVKDKEKYSLEGSFVLGDTIDFSECGDDIYFMPGHIFIKYITDVLRLEDFINHKDLAVHLRSWLEDAMISSIITESLSNYPNLVFGDVQYNSNLYRADYGYGYKGLQALYDLCDEDSIELRDKLDELVHGMVKPLNGDDEYPADIHKYACVDAFSKLDSFVRNDFFSYKNFTKMKRLMRMAASYNNKYLTEASLELIVPDSLIYRFEKLVTPMEMIYLAQFGIDIESLDVNKYKEATDKNVIDLNEWLQSYDPNGSVTNMGCYKRMALIRVRAKDLARIFKLFKLDNFASMTGIINNVFTNTGVIPTNHLILINKIVKRNKETVSHEAITKLKNVMKENLKFQTYSLEKLYYSTPMSKYLMEDVDDIYKRIAKPDTSDVWLKSYDHTPHLKNHYTDVIDNYNAKLRQIAHKIGYYQAVNMLLNTMNVGIYVFHERK